MSENKISFQNNDLLIACITDVRSLEAITLILSQQGQSEIVLPQPVWESIFDGHNSKYALRNVHLIDFATVNNVNIFWKRVHD